MLDVSVEEAGPSPNNFWNRVSLLEERALEDVGRAVKPRFGSACAVAGGLDPFCGLGGTLASVFCAFVEKA